MEWMDAYPKDREPEDAEIAAFVDSPLWEEMNAYVQGAYGAKPKKAYSGCSGQPGWNVKYQRAGRSLCTLYPLAGRFIALVVIGERERGEAELMMPGMSPYVQGLFARAGHSSMGAWLMVEVADEATLEEVKRLIALRRAPDRV